MLIGIMGSYKNDIGNVKFPWAQVASHMNNRSGKQCRERWHNYLKSDLKKGEWTGKFVMVILESQHL